jgi:hypothetical protein
MYAGRRYVETTGGVQVGGQTQKSLAVWAEVEVSYIGGDRLGGPIDRPTEVGRPARGMRLKLIRSSHIGRRSVRFRYNRTFHTLIRHVRFQAGTRPRDAIG